MEAPFDFLVTEVAVMDWVSKFLGSKRNIVLVVTVATIAWQMYGHIQRGEPIPEALIAALTAAFSAWQVSDSIRPTMPKAAV